MAKIVMPKNSALLEEVEAVLKIYYDAGEWLSNDEYKQRLKNMIGDDQYASSYTKKAQITSYFGFTEWEDITNDRSLRRITEKGKTFYEHLQAKDVDGIYEDLVVSLEENTFGRNNFGCPASDSDVEPPILFIRAIMDLGYLTYKEFAFLLWKLEDCGGNYTDAKQEIIGTRSRMCFDIPNEATKYTDAKPIMVLVRWGLLSEDETNSIGGKHIIINPTVLDKYRQRLLNLKIYNIDKDICEENAEEHLSGLERECRVDKKEVPDKMVVSEKIKANYSIDELGVILKDMYDKAPAGNQSNAIRMFGIKYGEIIEENEYAAAAITKASGIDSTSYSSEVSKGISIYKSIKNNEYGIHFADKESEEKTVGFVELPTFSPRTTTIYPLNCILYGAPGTGKTFSTAQYALAIAKNEDLESIKGKPREEIMATYNGLVKEGRIVFTTFHQNYGYEDFIQGIRPDVSSGDMRFKTVDGVFKSIAQNAMKTPDKDFVIVIDEINRANISKVFGELITLIEDDKRWGERNALSVTLPSGEPFAVPNNLYIIGTMNSADKSISLIDTALRRRFEFIEFVPELSLVSDTALKKVLKKLNEGIESQLNNSDLLIGHSYFIDKTENDLEDIMNRSIIPLLYEYFFDDKKKVEIQLKEALDGLDYDVVNSSMGRLKVIKKAGE